MSLRRSIAFALAASLTLGSAPFLLAAGAQTTVAPGTISGKATDEAKKPYTDYMVQVRDVATGQIVTSVPLDDKGLFVFTGLALDKRYSVELVFVKNNANKIICTEGPYPLTATTVARVDVNINCGTNPAAWWLLAAGAGAAAAVAFTAASSSNP